MELMETGKNENCRLFNTSDNTYVSPHPSQVTLTHDEPRLSPVTTRGTLTSGDIEDYQVRSAIACGNTVDLATESFRYIKRWQTTGRCRGP